MSDAISIKHGEDSLIIIIRGKFVFKMYKDFSEVYQGKKGQYKKYILDLRDTRYVDTSALGMLLQMREYLNASRENIHIINCNDYVKSIFQVSNFDQMFTLKSIH